MPYGVLIRWEMKIPQNIRNLETNVLRNVTNAYRRSFLTWWNRDFIPEGLKQIRTGSGRFPRTNQSPWKEQKAMKHGINHSLGILSGQLYSGFSQSTVNLSSNRQDGSITVRMRFNRPYYIKAIEEGAPANRARAYPFVKSTLSTTLPRLTNRMKIGLSKESDILGV